MRALIVEPGPWFSVQDVARGWQRGLARLGARTASVNIGDRLGVYEAAHLKDPVTGEWRKAFPDEDAVVTLASKSITVAAMEFWPDLVIVISGFFVPPAIYNLLRARRIPVATIFTESPYEDAKQAPRAAWCDVAVVNDPTNLEAFQAHNPRSAYFPAAFDPEAHCPGPAQPDCHSEFAFVGTGYPSRIGFFEQVDWAGIDVVFAGNWQLLTPESPLRKYLAHDVDACCPNDQAVDLYRATSASANLYRREAQEPGLEAGWAVGPREVELAATGTFFLREPRGEGDGLFPMLPTFTGPGEFGEQLRWWLTHPEEREAAAVAARAAVTDRTFEHNARRLLELLDL